MRVWEIVSAIVRAILIMSVGGSVIALMLFALRPLIKNRVPKLTQYYMWLLVVAAFLIPFSVFITLPFNTPLVPVQRIIETNIK